MEDSEYDQIIVICQHVFFWEIGRIIFSEFNETFYLRCLSSVGQGSCDTMLHTRCSSFIFKTYHSTIKGSGVQFSMCSFNKPQAKSDLKIPFILCPYH